MPKNIEDKELEKEKIIQSIETLKNEGVLNNDEVSKLMIMLEAAMKRSQESKLQRIIRKSIKYLFNLTIMYFVCVLSFGAFFNDLAISNNYSIFIISLIISIPLLFVHRLPIIMADKIFERFFLLKYLIVIVLFFTIPCLINSYLYKVFEFTSLWIYYLIIASIIYILVCKYIRLKRVKKGKLWEIR